MFTKKTLRRLNPTARKLAVAANEAEKLRRHLRALVEPVNRLELDSKALFESKKLPVATDSPESKSAESPFEEE